MDRIGLFNHHAFVIAALLAVVFTACSKKIYIPVEHTEYVHITDSVAVHDTTIQYRLEKEYIEKYATDTLKLETAYSNFVAFQDTLSGKLSGKAWNKQKIVEIPTQFKERVVYRDSISKVEVPVEVEKPVPYTPRLWKFFGWLGILSLVAGVLLILRKLGILKFL